MKEEILRLTKFWMDYVSLSHHKDRDGHWYIEEKWSYGEPPEYEVSHYGYIASEIERVTCYTYEEAQAKLVEILTNLIKENKKWALDVVANPERYDRDIVQQAQFVTNFEI